MSNQSKNHAYRYLAKTPSVQVGDLILGGVVAYVLQPGDFGYGGSITGFITTVAQPTRYNVYGTIAWSGATSLALAKSVTFFARVVAWSADKPARALNEPIKSPASVVEIPNATLDQCCQFCFKMSGFQQRPSRAL